MTKQVEWQEAFMEWHRHRTAETAAEELRARQAVLATARQVRLAKRTKTVFM